MGFSGRLLSWYATNKRSFPWRGNTDPYKVWLSEIILQQTRVDQGIVYFQRFVEAFPDVHSLAAAPEELVLRMWQGLGYYTRARNLHISAKIISFEKKGVFPKTRDEWISLKGVGPYVAAAIASIVSKEAVPALDGNVYRVLSRMFAVEESIDTPRGKEILHSIASELIDHANPGNFNQALMDFGSLVCKPAKPDCHHCIFNLECMARRREEVEKFPVRKEKRKARDRYFNYFFIYVSENHDEPLFCIQQRTANDIWKHLYEWPLLETNAPMQQDSDVFSVNPLRKCLSDSNKATLTCSSFRLKHQLTHQTIHAEIFVIRADPSHEKEIRRNYRLVNRNEFEQLAKPRLIENAYQTVMACLSARGHI